MVICVLGGFFAKKAANGLKTADFDCLARFLHIFSFERSLCTVFEGDRCLKQTL